MTKPKLIIFDVGGTLIEVRGSVGEIYREFASRYGVEVSADLLQPRFGQAFRRQPPLAFRDFGSAAELQRLEFEWWRVLVRQVFAEIEFPRFEDCFAELFEYFRHAQAWQIFDDVMPTLQALRARGVTLAVLSNFDSRLPDLLRDLALETYFSGVHYSTRLGAAKPESAAFQQVLRAHGVGPAEAWHVGDAWREDYEGACQAGLTGWLIERRPASPVPPPPPQLSSLRELAVLIDQTD
jgi:putative hydrolase of the HAD superfamily